MSSLSSISLTAPTMEHEAWHSCFPSHLMSHEDMLLKIITVWTESIHPTLRAENIHIHLVKCIRGNSPAPMVPTIHFFPQQLAKKTCDRMACIQLWSRDRGPGFPASGNLGSFWQQCTWKKDSQPSGSIVLIPLRDFFFPQNSLLISHETPTRAWGHPVVSVWWCQILCDYRLLLCHGAIMGEIA